MSVAFDKVHAGYGPREVLGGVSLAVRSGEIVALLGRSGSGKSTLLQVAAGLLAATNGRVERDARLACVFQEPRLLPWRSVLDNAAFGLKCRGVGRRERRRRADAMLARLGMADSAAAWPAELSGGMRQRVALARAFLVNPRLLLLDEPFSSLDPGLRQELLAMLRLELHRDCAVLLVTHDVTEAAAVADRIFVLDHDPARIVVDRSLPRATSLRSLPEALRIAADLFAEDAVAAAFAVDDSPQSANVVPLRAAK
jgi:NitT/TauT family transport system ATP-binding protein